MEFEYACCACMKHQCESLEASDSTRMVGYEVVRCSFSTLFMTE